MKAQALVDPEILVFRCTADIYSPSLPLPVHSAPLLPPYQPHLNQSIIVEGAT